MDTTEADLLPVLRALELELHHPGARSSRERLAALLHPDFHEIGRSGRPYDRQTVIAFLAARPQPPEVKSDQFQVRLLGPGVALLTYHSVQRESGAALRTWRMSLWVDSGGSWQLRYHQGTPAGETP